MVFHMKTTLVIDDGIMKQLKAEAARQRVTLSELVETALRRMLNPKTQAPKRLLPLPSFNSGGALVDLDDRDALYRAMGGRR